MSKTILDEIHEAAYGHGFIHPWNQALVAFIPIERKEEYLVEREKHIRGNMEDRMDFLGIQIIPWEVEAIEISGGRNIRENSQDHSANVPDPHCKHCEFINKTFSGIDTNREYWLMTEVFVYLHDGQDQCPKPTAKNQDLPIKEKPESETTKGEKELKKKIAGNFYDARVRFQNRGHNRETREKEINDQFIMLIKKLHREWYIVVGDEGEGIYELQMYAINKTGIKNILKLIPKTPSTKGESDIGEEEPKLSIDAIYCFKMNWPCSHAFCGWFCQCKLRADGESVDGDVPVGESEDSIPLDKVPLEGEWPEGTIFVYEDVEYFIYLNEKIIDEGKGPAKITVQKGDE